MRNRWLVTCRDLMPVFSVLLVIEIFTPFDQIIDLRFEFSVLHADQVLVVERIVVQFLELFGHIIIDFNIWIFAILFLDELSILGVSVQLSEPSYLPETLLSLGQGSSFLWIKMERLRLIRSINLNLIKGRQNLIINWPPSIILNTFIPSFMVVSSWFIILDVDRGLPLFLFHLVVITRSESIDVADGAMDEHLVVDQWWELQAS